MDSFTTVAQFAELARGFCNWCESPALGSDAQRHAASLVARLHAAALTLVREDGGEEIDDDSLEIPPQAERRARANLEPFLGTYYRSCLKLDPRVDSEIGMGDLGDDLIDIYLDVRRGLVGFDLGDLDAAFLQWSEMHSIHWGAHAVGALTAIHRLPRDSSS